MNTILRKFYLSLVFLSSVYFIYAQPASRPNVLLIYTDDHRYSGVHALGGEAIMTPNIDALAADGIAFTNAFLMGSFHAATCVPSRAMLNTGRNLFQLKDRGRVIPEEHTTIGEAFKQADYYSFIVGKWHQDRVSLFRSFNSGDMLMSLGAYLTDHYRMPMWDWDESGKFPREDGFLVEYDKNGETRRRLLTENDKRGPVGDEKLAPHSSELFANAAVEFISDYEKKQSFFMYLAFHAPHDPRQAPQEYKDMYPVEYIDLPPSYMPQHTFDNGYLTIRDEALAPWPRTPAIAAQHLSDYYAIITHLDVQIGRVIKALKASGKYENTLIVLAGDSGLGVGNHGLMGKQNLYDEDGIHVPFILSGDLIVDKGRREDALCYIHDIYPTICDFAGVPIPSSVTGKSLMPLISNESDKIRDYTYHAFTQYQRAYRKGDYKLIEYVKAPKRNNPNVYGGSRVTQLFNIKEDKWEVNNLSFLPEYADTLKQMQSEMRAIAEMNNDSEETSSLGVDFWDYY